MASHSPETGSRLEPEARRILGLADAVIEGRRDDRSLVRSRLDISCPEEGLGALTSVVIAAYRAAHPNIDVVVHEETPYESIETLGRRDNPYGIALWGVDYGNDRFHVDGVYSERIDLLESDQSHLASAIEPVAIADVLDLAFVRPTPFMQSWAHPQMLDGLRNGSSPRFARSDPFHHIMDCVEDVIDGRAVAGISVGTAAIPGTAVVPIDADVTTTMGAIMPAGEQRQHVRNFGTIAATSVGNFTR